MKASEQILLNSIVHAAQITWKQLWIERYAYLSMRAGLPTFGMEPVIGGETLFMNHCLSVDHQVSTVDHPFPSSWSSQSPSVTDKFQDHKYSQKTENNVILRWFTKIACVRIWSYWKDVSTSVYLTPHEDFILANILWPNIPALCPLQTTLGSVLVVIIYFGGCYLSLKIDHFLENVTSVQPYADE